MRLLGAALSGAGLPFVSASYRHSNGPAGGSETVVCETQEQCDAVAAWAAREGWNVATRVATAEEAADAAYWRERT